MKKYLKIIPFVAVMFLGTIIHAEVYDQIIPSTKEHPYIIYYNYKYKEPVKVQYTIFDENTNKLNITKRPGFRSDKKIPKKYRSYTSDYTHSGYDRGHMAPDALFDYNQTVLKNVYIMSNITPQLPNLNRKVWKYLEAYVRYQVIIYKKLKIENYIFFEEPIKRIGKHKIAVPTKFLKTIIYLDKDMECYLFLNNENSLFNKDPINYKISNELCNFYRKTLYKNKTNTELKEPLW